jgi:hypothetical protein
MRQAPMTANEYLMSAIDHIDLLLVEGYAKAHPELIGAFMQTSAIELGAGEIARAIQGLGDVIDSHFAGTTYTQDPLQREMVEMLNEIVCALDYG